MAVSARRASKALAHCKKTPHASPARVGFRAFGGTALSRTILSSPRCLAKGQADFAGRTSVPGLTSRTAHQSAAVAGATSPIAAYKTLVAEGKITLDPRQEAVMAKLSKLADTVQHYIPPMRSSSSTRAAPKAAAQKNSGGFFGGLFGGGSKSTSAPKPQQPQVERLNIPAGVEKGLYVWGGCGTGKTFMMDLFHDNIQIKKKRRVHFHEWMIEVHEKLHRLQKKNSMVTQKANTTWTAEAAMAQRKALKSQGYDGTHSKTAGGGQGAEDLVAQVAQEMMDEAWLLCFDEFQVTHISDAIIMKRLFFDSL